MQIPDLTRRSKLPKIDSSDILPLAFAGLSLGVLILSVALFWLAVSFSRLANQKPPTLVQQVDGHAFSVRPADHSYREPEVIRRFVSDWAVMTFTWGKLPGDQKKTVDEGMAIAGNKRVSTAAWEASFALAPDFRDAFLHQLATDVIPDGVFDGKVSAVLVPQQVSPPQTAGEGRWQVDLIATRILFDDANPAGTTIPFNRRIFVRAVEPARQPLIQDASEYQRVVYRMLEGGIQIEEIRPLTTEELNR
jgi:hypothetical protein